MILTNARILTSDSVQPFARTVVIEGGRIVSLQPEDVPAGPDVRDVVDLGGRTVLPGFIDAHTHPSMVAASRWHIALPRTDDLEELLEFVRDHAARHDREKSPFLYFEYYSDRVFRIGRPTRQLLDEVVEDRPVLLQNFSEHEAWVNSRMLELMGVDRDTPDPVPGLEMFVRDADGEPTGCVREMAHLHFLDRMFDRMGLRPPGALTPEAVGETLRFFTEHGVTALFEALLEDDSMLQAISELDREGRFPFAYEGAARFRSLADLPAAIDRLTDWQRRFGTDRIRLRTLKLFLDGTNESGTGALLEPVVNGGSGGLAMDAHELAECLLLCDAAGVDLHIHLVGDRAFRTACDAVESARARIPDRDLRSQVTLAHCELVDPADMARPAALGIIVNWTPHWSGGYFGDGARTHLGVERWNRMYQFRDIAAAGAPLALGSDVVTDYELHRAAPLFGMQIAATRLDPEETLDAGGARPEQDATLPVDLLVRGYTIAAARQLRRDDERGSLSPGKVADLVVLGADPMGTDPAALSTISIDAVLVAGRVVAGALPAAEQPEGRAAELFDITSRKAT